MHKLLLAICVLINVAGFGQVNLQTGAAQASFPLFQYNDAKSRLSTGISLNYISGSGMRANDMASSSGTGWKLQAGGFIARIQQGEPDDQRWVNENNTLTDLTDMVALGNNMDFYYPTGYLYTGASPQYNMSGEASYTPLFVRTSPAEYKPNFEDREQDVFSFQFNGHVGRFVISKNKEVQLLDDSKLKIRFNEADMRAQKIRTKITDFTIIDEAGIQYSFSAMELSEAFKYNSTGTVNLFNVYKGVSLKAGMINQVVTRWFLKEIKNPRTNETITFNYEDYVIDMDGPKHVTQTIVEGQSATNHVVIERIKRTSKRLLSINTPDAYQVNFNYSPLARIDVPGENPLTDISVLYNNNVLYGYHFNYKYFMKKIIVPYEYAFQDAEKRYARLCLTDFQKVGNGIALPPYVFTYNLADPQNSSSDYYWNVAPAFTLWSDHWGYYDPNLSSTGGELADGGPRSPFGVKICEFSADYLWESFGILKSIQYPEGGSLEYQFEHNQAANSPYTFHKTGGIRVAKTIIYDGISHNNDIIKQYRYVQADGTTSSGWGFEAPIYDVYMGLRQYKLKASDNPRGGINVKDNAASLVSTMLWVRASQMAGGTLGGSLFNGSTFQAVGTQMIIAFVVAKIIDFFSPDYKDYSLRTIKNDNYNLMNPLPQQYNRVEVIDGGANNGKVVYEFTNPATSAPAGSTASYTLLDPNQFAPPYSSGKPRSANWIYGAPQYITWFNSANQPVRKVENVYNPIVRTINNNDFLSLSWYVNKNAVNVEDKHNLYDASNVTNETYLPVQGRMELTKTIETNYNKNGESSSTETSYTYSPNNFQVQTISKKDSKGDYMGSTTYYSADYNIDGIINTMNGANIMNAPVSINNWVKSGQAASQEKLINATVTEYGVTGNADISPIQVYSSELNTPQDNTVATVSNFDPANFKNYSYLKPQSALIYSGGNLVQTIANYGNFSKSAIYDYNQRQVVAEVKNATAEEIRYTSFESDAGPWTYNVAGIKNTFSPTGRRCFDLTQGNVVANVTAARTRPYIVSLWTTGQVTVTASQQFAPSKTGPTINGWTYYEFELPAGAAANVSISGNGLLDEVRYYPKGATMVTHTYDPGVGRTSECDDNNRITLYEYDGLGRLIKVRDQNYNLIKTYEYHYKQ